MCIVTENLLLVSVEQVEFSRVKIYGFVKHASLSGFLNPRPLEYIRVNSIPVTL